MNPGSKYVQLLMQNMGGANNGTHAGGLAHALQSGLNGFIAARAMAAEEAERKRKEEEAERQRQAMAQAAQAMTGRPEQTIQWDSTQRQGGFMPDAQGDPTTTFAARAPNRDLAMQLLAQEPSTAPMAMEIMLRQTQGKPPTSVQEYEYAKQNGFQGSYEEWVSQGGGDAKFSMSPVWGTDANGNPVLLQLSNQGGVQQVPLPSGVTPQRGQTSRVDVGDSWAIIDAGGNIIRYEPKGFDPMRKIVDDRVISVDGRPPQGTSRQAPQGITSAPPSNVQMPPVSPPPAQQQQPPTVPPAGPSGRRVPPPPMLPPQAQGTVPPQGPSSGVSVIELPPNPNARTEGQAKLDQEYAKEYNTFIAGGGAADTQKNLAQLDGVLTRLRSVASGQSKENLTGNIIGSTPDIVGNVMNPAAVDVRQQVEEVVQRNLRTILGAQFTEEEGKRLIARAYNPSLPEADNVARLTRLVASMRAAYQAKMAAAEYFERNGTLKGFNGRAQFSMDYFNSALDGGGAANPPSGASAPPPLFQAPALGGVETPQTPSGMSDEEIMRLYGVR